MPEIKTVHEHIAWSYANLARAHAALTDGRIKYKQIHHIIRSKLYNGLLTGKMNITSFYEDEKLKTTALPCCSYCGSRYKLSLDHLIPRMKKGSDAPENLVLACRSCNSSKGSRDLMKWCNEKKKFPGIFLLRRYIKLIYLYCNQENLLELTLEDVRSRELPFDIFELPYEFPPLAELVLTPAARQETSSETG
jgi:disulfide oxidoreductase YuzD